MIKIALRKPKIMFDENRDKKIIAFIQNILRGS